jgi:IS30 family transposase
MHRNRRVDPLKLQKLREQGFSGREMARIFGVIPSAIWRNLKALGRARNGDIILRSAKKINDRKLDAMRQLERINQAIEQQLDEIQAELETAKGGEKAVLRDLQIKHTAEIRKQLDLLLQIGKALYNVEEVTAFQKTVLEEIGNESPECRKRIFARLQSRRASSGLIGFSQPGV